MARSNQRRRTRSVGIHECSGGGRPLIYLQFTPPVVSLSGGRPSMVDLAAEGGRRSQLGGAGPQHVLVIRRGNGGADEGTHPEDPLQSHRRQDKQSSRCKTFRVSDCSSGLRFYTYQLLSYDYIQFTNGAFDQCRNSKMIDDMLTFRYLITVFKLGRRVVVVGKRLGCVFCFSVFLIKWLKMSLAV